MDYSKSWSYKPYDPVTTDVHGDPGKPYQFLITHIKPTNCGAAVSWQTLEEATRYKLIITPYGGNSTACLIKGVEVLTDSCSAQVTGLQNDIDYEVRVEGYCDNRFVGKALVRWLRCGDVPGTVVNYIHADDYSFSYSGRSTATPGILRLPDGELLVSNDVYWGDAPQNLTQIFSSLDDGASWQYVCDIVPCFWGKLFWHNGAVYMLGCATECGDLLVGCSHDNGRTWSAPVVICSGGTRATGGPMRSSLPVVEHKGRLWTSMDVGSHPIGYHDTVAVSVAVDSDLMNPDNWVCSAGLRYDPNWEGASQGAPTAGFLEGNMVVGSDGNLYDIMRYETRGGNPSYGLAGMVRIDADHPEQMPQLHKIINFEGNLSRFTIAKHPTRTGYYATVSRVIDEPTYYRGRLSLMFSEDLEHWELVRDLLDMGTLDLPDWPNKTAFQYPDMFIENDTVYLVSRTAVHGAYNYHNANYITFHKFPINDKVGELT